MKRLTVLAVYGAALLGGGALAIPCAMAAAPPQAGSDFSAEQQLEQTQQTTLAPLEKSLQQSNQHQSVDGEKAAQELDEASELSSGIASKLPSFENLAKLEVKMRSQPKNLDHYFAHAQMASQLGEYELAAQTYEAMLALAPALDRVRLDLGALYLRLGKFEQAREQLQMVLAKNTLPPPVRANVEKVMAKVDSELNEHDISALLSAGINWDTNATSAPRGEAVIVQDTFIPLADEQLAKRDLQGYYALGLTHTYRPRALQDDHFARRWKTSANWYQSKQSTQESIDVKVQSLRTGPEFQSKQSGILFNPALNYSVVTLDGNTYMRNTALEAHIDVPIDEQWLVSGDSKVQWRDFVNSPTVSTFELREGLATQQGISARYIATGTDIFNLGLTFRREHTQEEFFDNAQYGATLGYTRILPHNSFANATLGYKRTNYEANDPLISQRTRHDNEGSAGLTLGHQIAEGLSVTMGYQYRSVQSNIRNFDYDNHRFSASITRQF